MANKKFKFIDLSDEEVVPQIDENKKNNNLIADENKMLLESNKKFSDVKTTKEEYKSNNYQNFNNYKEENKMVLNVDSNIKNENIDNVINYDSKLEEIKNVVSKFDKYNEKNSEKFFDDRKIENLFSYKEKLDIKTNIYLKKNLVIKIQELSKKTGDSRSLIINKLIELALKQLEQ